MIEDADEGDDVLDFSEVTEDLVFIIHVDGSVSVEGDGNALRFVEHVEELIGGSGDNRFEFEDGAVFNGNITGFANGEDEAEAGGQSTLDYRQYSTTISVNLFAGAATGVSGGIGFISHVFGGSGKDKIDNDGGTSRSNGGNVPKSNLQQVLSDHLFGTIEPLRRVLLGLPADQEPQPNNVIFDLLTGNRLTLDQLGSPIATSVGQDSFLLTTDQGSDTYTSLLTSQEVFDYVEMDLTVTINRGPRGTLHNSYVIFDYQSDTDYKFVGINAKTNKLEIGRYTSEGWIVDAKVKMKIKANKEYDLRLILNHDTVSMVVNNKKAISHTFDSKLNNGELGLGTHQATSEFKNFEIQRYNLQ